MEEIPHLITSAGTPQQSKTNWQEMLFMSYQLYNGTVFISANAMFVVYI